jgi:hypothetical protein
MKKIIFLLVVSFVGCSTSEDFEQRSKSIRRAASVYKIYCEMPGSREVKSFAVDFDNIISPTNSSDKIWSFKTLDGRLVRSSICHTEVFLKRN